MKRHIKLLTSVAVTGTMILSISTSALATSAPQTPNTRPGVTTPATPTAPAPGNQQTPTTLPAPAPGTPTTLPAPAPGGPNTPNRPHPNAPSVRPQPVPHTPTAPAAPQTPSTRPQPAPNAPGNNQSNHGGHGAGTHSARMGNSILSNLVEYYENLVKHGVISQETATRIIDYMLARYTGVSSNIGQVAVENKSSAIKFEQRADGGAMFFEQKPDGKVIFFEQTPGKGAVYHEHNPFGNVNALNSAIVHSQMVNEGVLTQAEAQAISAFEAKNKNDEDK